MLTDEEKKMIELLNKRITDKIKPEETLERIKNDYYKSKTPRVAKKSVLKN